MTSRGGGPGLLFGGLTSDVAGSNVRHDVARHGGIPAPYTNLHNPLAPTPENVQRGAAIYDAQCASCHGVTGLGDGPGARRLKPPPAHLGWLAGVPASRVDAYMFWATSEGGGGRFGTGMPAYKDKLTTDEIWSVIGYIQARLPKAAASAR
jgi:mono/diheme cytochrome c family protein